MACYQTVSQTVIALFTNAHMHHSIGLDESIFLVFRLKYSRSILNLYCGCWCPGSVMVFTMSLSPLRKNHSTYVTSVWIVCLQNSTSYPSVDWLCSLQWRHNGLDGVSNHQPHLCLLSRYFGRRSKKSSKLRVTGLCAGDSPGTGEFPAQMASNAENVSIRWRHHDCHISWSRYSHWYWWCKIIRIKKTVMVSCYYTETEMSVW